jgi:hypothetical protein
MPASRKHSLTLKPSASLPDAALIDHVQRQTFRFFWEGAHPVCGLARDRTGLAMDPDDDHGLFPHFINGRTGAAMRLGRKDDGSDVVESSFLFQGLLCARQYFNEESQAEKSLRERITWLWRDAEWNWHARDGRHVLTWHWSPNNGFSLDHEIRGWNECLVTYVLIMTASRKAAPLSTAAAITISICRWGRTMAGLCSSAIIPSAGSIRAD